MKKEQAKVIEAVNQLNGLFNVRERFFIGTAIKDALVLGRRSALLTEDEATELQDLIENNILSDARQHDDVSAYLNSGSKSAGEHHQQDENSTIKEEMTPKKYYDIFIKPALDIIVTECPERFGLLFVKYICTGEQPSDDALTDDEKILWNVFMAMIEIKFNTDFSEAISEDEA